MSAARPLRSLWTLRDELLVLGARRVYRERRIRQLLARIRSKKGK
jgi:hypothetical protein